MAGRGASGLSGMMAAQMEMLASSSKSGAFRAEKHILKQYDTVLNDSRSG
jgi:hypothetical protein